MDVDTAVPTLMVGSLRAYWSTRLGDAKAALSELPCGERGVQLFWFAGPFILLIERSPADF